MKKSLTLITAAAAAKLLVAALVLTSCVSKKQYLSLQSDYGALQNELANLQGVHSQTMMNLASR